MIDFKLHFTKFETENTVLAIIPDAQDKRQLERYSKTGYKIVNKVMLEDYVQFTLSNVSGLI